MMPLTDAETEFVLGRPLRRLLSAADRRALAGRSVLIWSVNAQVQGARWLAAGVRLLVGVFFAALELENLGFGRDIALVVLAILLGGFVFATALSYGLAGQDLARQSLDRMTREARGEDHETLSHL